MRTHFFGATQLVSRIALAASLLGCIASAHAELVTINFTGRVFGDNALNARGIWAGQGFDVTGSYSFNAGLQPTLNTSSVNTFLSNNALNASFASDWSMTFSVGSTTRTLTESDGLFNFGLFDKTTSGSDVYSFTGAGNKASIRLTDSVSGGNDAVASLDGTVPTGAPDLSKFNSLNQGIYNFEAGSVNFLKFDVLTADLAVSPAPEPEVYAMLAVGMGVMGWAARRRKQRLSQPA